MLCFDKLKLITSIDYINNIDNKHFISNYKEDELLYQKYIQKTPFSILIMVNYDKNELVLEFTSKILKDNCIQLINQNNIRECISNIHDLNICDLDIDNILRNSQVTKCDVTKDVNCEKATLEEVKQMISLNITNRKKWIYKSYQNNGIVLENVVSTPRYKKRFTVYDKRKELDRSENQDFFNSISNPETVKSYYDGKIRFEQNINTMAQIRQLLKIEDNLLEHVLSAKTNPLLSVFDEAIRPSNKTQQSRALKDYERELLIKSCDYDLFRVEATVRGLISKNTPVRRAMEPYRILHGRLTKNTISGFNLREMVV